MSLIVTACSGPAQSTGQTLWVTLPGIARTPPSSEPSGAGTQPSRCTMVSESTTSAEGSLPCGTRPASTSRNCRRRRITMLSGARSSVIRALTPSLTSSAGPSRSQSSPSQV